MVKVALATPLSTSPAANPRACTVAVAVSVNGPAYSGELLVGVDPSVVYRMAAPGVAVPSVTDTAPAKVPPAGLIVGVATAGAVIVKVALATALSTSPGANARARTVLVAVTLNGLAYSGELLVGVDPFVVYRIVAPGVEVPSVTDTAPANVPPAGLIVGVAAVAAVMVKVALATALSIRPAANARALIVVVLDRVNGLPYKGELPVGIDPSVV
jgi:hypothetical protein